MNTQIAEKIAQVEAEIEHACHLAGRERSEVQLLAVSKTRPAETLREAYELGLHSFGENYLQEALDKIEALSDLEITWHFIGPIQSNKTRPIAENFQWVHSVDRLKIAHRLSEQRPDGFPPLNVCLQINISAEVSKSGCSPEEALQVAQEIAALPNLCLRGLMAIPEATDDERAQHAAFAAMRQLFDTLKPNIPTLDTLSMGMSGDLEAAVEEGSTMVRIGTALFGPRPPKTAAN